MTSKPGRMGSQDGTDDNFEEVVVKEDRAEVGVWKGWGLGAPWWHA